MHGLLHVPETSMQQAGRALYLCRSNSWYAAAHEVWKLLFLATIKSMVCGGIFILHIPPSTGCNQQPSERAWVTTSGQPDSCMLNCFTQCFVTPAATREASPGHVSLGHHLRTSFGCRVGVGRLQGAGLGQSWRNNHTTSRQGWGFEIDQQSDAWLGK